MAKSYEMYVFDWDGTLMDTTRLIMQGYQHASKALGYPVPSDELVLSTIGLNRSDSIALCCCDCPKGRYSEFIQAYMDWYVKRKLSWNWFRASDNCWRTCTKTASVWPSRPERAEKG